MKRLTLLLGALLLTAAALAQTAVPPTVRIAHGPYVLNVTEDGFTVVWDAMDDAIGWVELAPMDGSHFYSAERPRYYDSHLGLCRVGRMHQVRIEGLRPHLPPHQDENPARYGEPYADFSTAATTL